MNPPVYALILNTENPYRKHHGRPVIEVFLEAPTTNSKDLVWKIKNSGDDWFWPEEGGLLLSHDREYLESLVGLNETSR